MRLSSRVPASGLYAIVDPDHCAGRDPVAVAAQLVQAGVCTVQLRVKGRSEREVEGLAKAIRSLKGDTPFTFIVNDFVEIACACDADGVHVGQGDMPVTEIRRLLGSDRIVGLSTHCLADVDAANGLPVDYIGFGAVFATPTKGRDHPVPGIAALREAAVVSRHPVVAIGGISPENVSLVLQTGVEHYAVLSALTGAHDIEKRVRAFLSLTKLMSA